MNNVEKDLSIELDGLSEDEFVDIITGMRDSYQAATDFLNAILTGERVSDELIDKAEEVLPYFGIVRDRELH